MAGSTGGPAKKSKSASATSKTFQERFHANVEQQKEFIEGRGRNDREKWSDLFKTLQDHLGIAADDIHVFKLRDNSDDNALWEGSPLFKRHALGVALISSHRLEKKPNTIASFSEAVVDRMNPPANGFEAIAVCTRNDTGKWTVSEVVAEQGSGVAASIKALCPEAKVTESTRPSIPTAIKSPAVVAPRPGVAAIANHLREAKNLILQGPPGTGKTMLAQEAIAAVGGVPMEQLGKFQFQRLLSQCHGNISTLLSVDDGPSIVWERVQLHPNYCYDDLIRGVTASSGEKPFEFTPEDKLLVHLALIAQKRPNACVVLVLDEINRCNLAAVLGELIFAIEPGVRGMPVRLQHPRPAGAMSEDVLAIPSNLYLLGTMNTADRSIGLVDYAIRRRFRFLDIGPDPAVIKDRYSAVSQGAQVAKLYETINSAVHDADLKVGHSYFLVDTKRDDWIEQFCDRVVYEVLPLLQEYLADGRAVDPVIRLLDGPEIRLALNTPGQDLTARAALASALKS